MKKLVTFLSWVIVVVSAVGLAYLFFKPVSLVGTTLITRKNIDLKNEVTKKYFPTEKRDLGQALLEKTYLKHEILKKNGIFLGKEEILAEEKRIEAQTQRPEFLLEIKKLFNGDLSEYRKVFVLPNLIDKTIYDFFSNSEEIHRRPLQQGLEIIKSLKDDSKLSLQIIATNQKLEFKFRKITPFLNEAEILGIPEDNRRFTKIPEAFKPNPEYEMWRGILTTLNEGEVFNKPVNVEDRLFILKLIKKNILNIKNLPKIADKKIKYYQYDVEFIILQKISFEDWLRDESSFIRKIQTKPQP